MSAAPSLLLRVVSGAMTGKAFRLTGAPAVVGRSPECAIAIAEPSLSRRHFEIRFEGDEWQVRDLRSRNGVTINSKGMREAVVRAGDEIRAGDVTFRLEVAPARLSEAPPEHPPAEQPTMPMQLFPSATPTLSAVSTAPADGTPLAILLSALRQEPPHKLYALIDGAQAFELAFSARLMGHELYTIFSGDLAEPLAHVGPCLAVIGEPSAFVQKWLEHLGSHAGVLFESAAHFEAVYAHLRSVFVATDEEGQEYFFRFYDPRVLRTFLPTCREDELREFFGPVERWIVETEDGSAFTSYLLDGTQLKTKDL